LTAFSRPASTGSAEIADLERVLSALDWLAASRLRAASAATFLIAMLSD